MDSFGDSFGRRAQVMTALDKLSSNRKKPSATPNPASMASLASSNRNKIPMPSACPTLPTGRTHAPQLRERDSGFFITGHPLEKYADKLADFHAKR